MGRSTDILDLVGEWCATFPSLGDVGGKPLPIGALTVA